MRFDPLIGGFKSGLLWVSSAPMAQYVCEYDSFCGLSGERAVVGIKDGEVRVAAQ